MITASGIGHAVVTGVNGAIGRVDAFGGMQGRPDGSKGMNFLLVGTDDRDNLAPDEKKRYHLGGAPCHCTDTIMLVHLSQDRSRASVVSIPRDTYVLLPTGPATPAPKAGTKDGTKDSAKTGAKAASDGKNAEEGAGPTATPTPATKPAKLNQAYALGGPRLTVQTVEQLTGVHVDHYLEVDFTSFMKTVDVIGGVPVCTSRPLKDPFSGLDLPVGTTTLNGGQALQYVRSRHLDPAADLGRMQRQQRFLAQVIHKITSSGTLSDPLRLGRVASTVLGSVRADQALDSQDLIGLGRAMKGFSPGSSEFTSVPLSVTSSNVPGVGSTVKWDALKAGRLWATIRADRPLTAPRPAPGGSSTPAGVQIAVDPAKIRVRVANGTSVGGLAASTQQALRATGFATTGVPATAYRHVPHTVIRYDPRWDDSARALAVALPGAQLVPAAGQGPVMRVTLGPDFAMARVRPVTAPLPDPGAQPAQGALTGDQVGCG
ncbi:transcriptional attenuator, LytR family [Actinacidiphila paucisporea]|uniref:Transcriptional attenuator, LytR family n=1 Tax=Actinacidiphila paucisporea TaxID=310782 RepID=A0A1M7FAA8_9ACTN|nr:LCP family protein [Actinacidiphila paucisporea]SHM00649.1 transcriptional attenuator, LytR family [Actinacidiphila paucisporea]